MPIGLRARSIVASVLVAAVAALATALVTVNATRDSIEEEQVRVEDVDRSVVDRLLELGYTTSSWSDAQELVDEIAASSGRHVALSDVDGRPLVASDGAAEVGDDPAAVLDPVAAVVRRAVADLPTSPDVPALPEVLTRGRAGAGALDLRSLADATLSTCVTDLPGEDDLPALDSIDLSLVCTTAVPPTGQVRTPLVRLSNRVAAEEHRCLVRRGVPSALVLVDDPDDTRPPVLTLHLPPEWTPADAEGRRLVDSAWRDCATAVLTRHLADVVAPSALLYLTETRTKELGLLERIGGDRILLALAAILLAAVVVSSLASRPVLRPVRVLTDATRRMAGGDLATRVPVRGHDEVARLGRSFNEMAGALAEADEQRRRMVGDVAHELRTPLANIRAYLEAGQDGVLDRDEAWTASLLEEALLLQHVVDDLQVLAQADAGRLRVQAEPGDVVPTVDAAVAALRGTAEAAGVRLERVGVPAADARHDRIRLRQVVGNLLSNAIRHAPAGSAVTVAVEAAEAGREGRVVRIEVRDHGSGVPDEHLPHLFERFYRVDTSRARETGGSGLGLAIVEQLVRAHGGQVRARNADGGGLAVAVELPAQP